MILYVDLCLFYTLFYGPNKNYILYRRILIQSSISVFLYSLKCYNHTYIFCHPLIVAVLVTLFFIVNNKIIFVQFIVSINTIALSFPILVGGTVECLLLNSHLECFLEFIPMLLAALADFSSKCIKGVKPILRPST
jgi:hypothetical protein